MPRYGLEFVDGNPFPVDTTIGVRLEDDVPILIPPEIPCPECDECEECPECDECVVLCKGWIYTTAQTFGGQVFSGSSFWTAPASFSLTNSGGQRAVFSLSPVGQFCNHRMRIVVTGVGISDPTNFVATHVYDSVLSSHSEVAVYVTLAAATVSGSITVQAQIDLTDAAPGAETWTNICGLVSVFPNGGK